MLIKVEFNEMENCVYICKFCNNPTVKNFQVKDVIKPPNGLQFEGCTELHGVLREILKLDNEQKKSTLEICQKCCKKFRGVYLFAQQRTKSEKLLCQLKDASVQLKKLTPIYIDIKGEFQEYVSYGKDSTENGCLPPFGIKMETQEDWVINENYTVKAETEDILLNENHATSNGELVILNLVNNSKNIDADGNQSVQQFEIKMEIITGEPVMNEADAFETKVDKNVPSSSLDGAISGTESFIISALNKAASTADSSYKCDQSDAKYKCLKSLETHKKTHTGIYFKCDQCDRQFFSELYLEEHKESDHSGKTFVCDICLRKFYNKNNLNMHKMTHSGIKYKCDQCGVEYKSKKTLGIHKKIHTSESFKCDQCNACFMQKSNLNRHLETHSNQTYACDQCDATYKNRYSLKYHKQSHIELVPTMFECDHCYAMYKRKKSLKLHKNSHNGVTFDCDQCDAKFVGMSRLRTHKLKHSNIRFKCDECDATYKCKITLKFHKQSHTGLSLECDRNDFLAMTP